MAMIHLPKCIMDDILQKDTQLNAQLGQVELKNNLLRSLCDCSDKLRKFVPRFHSRLNCETRRQDSFSLKLLLHTQAKHTIASMQADKVNMLQQLAQGGMQVSQIQEALSHCQHQLQRSYHPSMREKDQGTQNNDVSWLSLNNDA